MENQSKEKELYQQYAAKVSELLSDEDAKKIFDSLSAGKNSYMRIDRVESSSYDSSWIDMIESCIPDLGTIINNPRLTTKETQDLVPVELARKTNSDSVKHLASHTQFIKDITDSGDVIPNKVLNIGSDDEIKTYENKFIATLLRRLVLFIEKRYEFIKRYATLHDHEILFFKNESEIGESTVSIETKIKVVSPKTDPISLSNTKYVQRIEQMRQFIFYFYNSKFMKAFKTEKNVRNPILQTNIIRKNPQYHHCYELYRFMEAYDKLGVAYNVDEKYSQFSTQELDQLNALMFANYLALQGKDKSIQYKEKNRNYKPTILTSSDDEEFVYGPLLKGPIEFVRVDEPYQRYLDSLVSKDIPDDPNKQEKEYYSQEIDIRKLNRQQYEEKVKLLERKKWQKIQFDKEVLARIHQREEEERLALEEQLEKKRKEEEAYLAKFRQRIVDEALRFRGVENENETIQEEVSYKPSAFTSMRGTLDFSNMSKNDQELLLQQLSLLHEEEENPDLQADSPSYQSQQIANLPEPKPMPVEEPKVEEESATQPVLAAGSEDENLPPLPKVIPLAPFDDHDTLTAGLEDDDKEVLKPIGADEKTEIPVRTIPVPVEREMDDDERLHDDEKKALLTSGLFEEDYLNSRKGFMPYRSTEAKIPFDDDEYDYIFDPFEKIRLLNKAYLEYENQHPESKSQPVMDETSKNDENDSNTYDPFLQLRLLNKAYKNYEDEHPQPAEEAETPKEEGKVESARMDETMTTKYVLYHHEKGYYVDKDHFSMNVEDAKVYEDYDQAIMDSVVDHLQIIKH
jgi:hypothetical protein